MKEDDEPEVMLNAMARSAPRGLKRKKESAKKGDESPSPPPSVQVALADVSTCTYLQTLAIGHV